LPLAPPPSAVRPAPALSVAQPSTLNSQPLPTIEADETPLADGSDLSFGPFTRVLAALLPESAERRAALKKSLRNAGYYEPHAWHNLAAARYLGVMLPIVIGLGLLLVAPPDAEPWIFAGLVLLPAMGWALPTLLVRRQAADRLAEIERAMPDLLDMMNMCVSQGLTVPASLQRVGADLESVSPALSQELKIVSDQARVGSLEQALVAFSKRVELPDVYSFTSLLVQTERMGTSMSQALAEYSDGMRETLRQQADQKANTASFKLLFPTALCLMPAVFMILLGPAIIEMSAFFREGGNQVLNTSMESAQDVLE
jgi:tight adherence protein C